MSPTRRLIPLSSRRPAGRARPARPWVGGVLASVLGLAVTVACTTPREPGAPATPVPAAAAESIALPYQLGVAREGNVVVVIESTGWAERTEVALELALQRAIPGAEGRCGEDVLPCADPTWSGAGSGPLDLTATPTLTDADWARVTRGQTQVVGTNAPKAPLLDCISVLPDAAATDLRAKSYVQSTRPGAGLQEFVLRYEDAAAAADAVARIRSQFLGCPDGPPAGDSAVLLHEHASSDGGTWWPVDEALVGDRTFPGRDPLTPN